MLFFIGLFICLVMLGFLADRLLIPLWGWLLLLAASISISLFLVGGHWLWHILVIAPAVAMAVPQVRINLLVRPLADALNRIKQQVEQPTKDAWLSELLLHKQEAASPQEPPKISVVGKELKLVYQYYHLLQAFSKQVDKKGNDDNISARYLLQKNKQLAGLGIDSAYGGEGMSVQGRCLLLLKLAAINPQTASTLANMNCGIQTLLSQYGGVRQKEKLLPALAKGEILCHTLDPQISYHWAAKKTQSTTQTQSISGDDSKQSSKAMEGIEIADANLLSRAIENIDADLIAVYVRAKEELSDMRGVEDTADKQQIVGGWLLLDDKTINSIKSNKQDDNSPVSPLFIPESLIIWASADELLQAYMGEKALYNLALTRAKDLAGAHKSSGLMAKLIASDPKHAEQQSRISSAAKKWRAAWLSKQVRDIHIQRYLQAQTSGVIDNLICSEEQNGLGLYERGLYERGNDLLMAEPLYYELIRAVKMQETDEEILVATDNWMGNIIGRMLRIIYLAIYNQLLPLVAMLGLANKSLNDKASPVGQKSHNLKNHYELMKTTYALLVDCSAVAMLVSGKTSNQSNLVRPSIISLITPLRSLYDAYAITNIDMAEEPEYFRSFYSAVLFRCKQDLHQALHGLRQDASMPASILPWLANLLLGLSPSHRLSSPATDYHIINYCSIPSQERNDFFADIELASEPFATLEEQVKLAWLVREIYTDLEDKGYSFNDAGKGMSVSEWHAELVQAEIISNEDKKILDDFHKNCHF